MIATHGTSAVKPGNFPGMVRVAFGQADEMVKERDPVPEPAAAPAVAGPQPDECQVEGAW